MCCSRNEPLVGPLELHLLRMECRSSLCVVETGCRARAGYDGLMVVREGLEVEREVGEFCGTCTILDESRLWR